MQILVNSDNHIEVTQNLTALVNAEIEDALRPFRDRTTRVEVHLTDENSSAKKGNSDKRCVIEARLAGLQPIAVTHHGTTVEQAVEGASEKMKETLNRVLEKRDDPKGRVSFAGESD